MDEQEIQGLVEEVSLQYFGMPFLHKAMFNSRLRTTGGRYLLNTHNIELNYRYYEMYGKEDLVEIVKHELCHYHLHITGKGYKHRDRDFRELLKKVGAPRFCKPMINEEKKETKVYTYECTGCSLQYVRRRQINTQRYVCGKCRGKLKLVVKTS
ncbi:SprT family protein [Bacillus cereus]|uniref:SprT family protein n=1 Tax=Bacillus nitratireducens TaxID=2026193 RepID=UPI000BED2520|nr:SprT family protein [Bacillus cereus]PEQ42534.1 SprT family protein [Bacillus cereus]PER35555.1 SprT family protein [Bacillus cereus]PEW85954.1 SprT family protein [Bacillus cereus]PEX91610.1 SprT family protein [Bacillus cereus]